MVFIVTPPPIPLIHDTPPPLTLENSQHIRRTRDAAGDITRLAADEERPAALVAALRGERLEVEQLADGAAPAGEEHLVQVVGRPRRPALEGRLVPGHGGEVVPDPAQHGLGLLHAAEAVRHRLAVRRDFGLRLCCERGHES